MVEIIDMGRSDRIYYVNFSGLARGGGRGGAGVGMYVSSPYPSEKTKRILDMITKRAYGYYHDQDNV